MDSMNHPGLSGKGVVVGKIGNVGMTSRQEADSALVSSNVPSSLVTSSIKSEQSMPVRSPSKLPPYKKPSSISASATTSNASGKSQTSSSIQATASTSSNILPQSSKPVTTVSKHPNEGTVKTPLRIKRKVE